jgi:hypothetical protein
MLNMRENMSLLFSKFSVPVLPMVLDHTEV